MWRYMYKGTITCNSGDVVTGPLIIPFNTSRREMKSRDMLIRTGLLNVPYRDAGRKMRFIQHKNSSIPYHPMMFDCVRGSADFIVIIVSISERVQSLCPKSPSARGLVACFLSAFCLNPQSTMHFTRFSHRRNATF